MWVRRRLAIVVVCAASLFLAAAVSVYGRTVTGTQNPQFRVTVTITPNHPVAGDTIAATVKIVNRTKHNHRGEWTVTWETPQSGISAALNGVMKPGVVTTDREHAKVTSTSPRGTYTISATVQDKSRGRSHASASVTVH